MEPNFFIVGAMKAGTTSLYLYLKNQDEIFMPENKEPNYFSRVVVPRDSPHTIRDPNEYFHLFQNVKNESRIGEASTTYLQDPKAPKLIHDNFPNAKIIIILRDPIERVYSQYLGQVRAGMEKDSFSNVIQRDLKNIKLKKLHYRNILLGSFYFENVKKFVETFGHENVLILTYENFIMDVKVSVKYILKFLEINSYNEFDPVKHNVHRIPKNVLFRYITQSQNLKKITDVFIKRESKLLKIIQKIIYHTDIKKPEISNDNLKLLKELYFLDVQNLELFLDRKFPWEL